MTDQAIYSNGAASSGRGLGSRGPITEATELIIDGDPSFKAELQRLALEGIQSGAQGAVEERLRERCESYAGLDINANDMLTPLARELLLVAFSNMDWQSLAEKLVEPQNRDCSAGPPI
jgi:hypothetical protein